MISYLDLLDLFAQFISLCPDLSTSILIPGIVMSELDGLRKNAQRTCAVQAQNANRWVADRLMAKIREGGAGVVRGQRDAATLVSGGSWRRHYYETGKASCTRCSFTYSTPL
ncbi:hypothetical protein BS47DRAFT_895858 [Hydnum rufescens UP504]|uniref:PIN domain-containing protein n=1 Tax=Hydnum rufescens UP504 TaxID=1448309 RepID=A0A9P6AYB2_9AGAM|nr:hypothetical protein BS47DRAFT_895858 [Hydnum rufescens UP504]